MKNINTFNIGLFIVVFLNVGPTLSQPSSGKHTLKLENSKVRCSVAIENGSLLFDKLEAKPLWCAEVGTTIPPVVETDADFALDVMYTDWQAPGKANNADNPILLTKKDFELISHSIDQGSKELSLYFKARATTIELLMTYRLDADAFFVRRNIAVMDTAFGHHFLRWIWVRKGNVTGISSVVKAGDFGQPVAMVVKHGGAFFGLEYPTSENRFESFRKGKGQLKCGQEFGQLIGEDWLESEWVVEAITPNAYVKDWFLKYVDAIRVMPLHPFTLYNSWYDLRSPEYPNVPQEHWMSEQSALRMSKLLRENMIEKHNIKLDAFVLDDGWDVYESDWVLRKEQWPHGLKPLAEELKKTNTSLGIWFGPTGGYSFRMKRVNWMKEHGYEVVGKTRDNSMLCLAGKHYSELFRKRVTDFVVNDGVGYYKWDGVQYSCSDPDHGHPIDIYSRRAVMESVIDKCRAVREKNPNIFLNITSGTWLSPWWVKYANTIWMQGADYGFSDVPSISQRDGAMTYRDFILYDDFRNIDLWFPIQNLMTHGIIKGKLESTGSPDEPLDKFTDDALLYCARGVTMYELYISPDILSEGEWNTLASSLTWARDRFAILSTTYMIGGNPMKRETYGYVHFKGEQGIVAARNPFIASGKLDVELSVAQGLSSDASSLVVEKVYPTHWIAPRLYKSGEKITVPLDGYETAVYEVYPLEEATVPLIAGVTFDVLSSKGSQYDVQYHSASRGARLLNPAIIRSMNASGKTVDVRSFSFTNESTSRVVTGRSVKTDPNDKSKVNAKLTVSETAQEAALTVLLTPDSTVDVKTKPSLVVVIDGKVESVKVEGQEGRSQWYAVEVQPGKHDVTMEVKLGKGEKEWEGKAFVWMIAQQQQNAKGVSFTLHHGIQERPMPPHPWRTGEVRKNVELGEARIIINSSK
ncbi:MAG: alpha-galactosidase [Ignavibacteriales bacterium]|nr:alpha-galactosidase [Ignavibacteriales bacterium]